MTLNFKESLSMSMKNSQGFSELIANKFVTDRVGCKWFLNKIKSGQNNKFMNILGLDLVELS
jgi:hypothetical protein